MPVQPRPWLVDNFDRWFEVISEADRRPRCVLVFCDNSGADLILGVMPFVLECLAWGAKVILTANSGLFSISSSLFSSLLLRYSERLAPIFKRILN